MRIIPAIDLMDGYCVRLKQGVQSSKKEYSAQPADMAIRWQQAGASLLHVVNLDGAFGQADANVRAISDILAALSIPLELGGGIRSLQDAEKWLTLGVARIIFGTMAVTAPELIRQAIQQFGADAVIVGVDAKDDRIAIKGWVEQSDKQLVPFVQELGEMGVHHIIYTDVARDGENTGPNFDRLAQLGCYSQMQLIASGGFSTTDHFDQLANLAQKNITGVIVGTALYEGRLHLADLINRYERNR